jgi:hypothetical protein
MSHVRDHCATPWAWWRREGTVWACSCGRLYRIGYFQFGKGWEMVEGSRIDDSHSRRPALGTIR